MDIFKFWSKTTSPMITQQSVYINVSNSEEQQDCTDELWVPKKLDCTSVWHLSILDPYCSSEKSEDVYLDGVFLN